MNDLGGLPDPPAVTAPDQLIEALRALRRWAGQPSLRQLRQLGGSTTDRAGRPIDALPEATTAYVLRGARSPRAQFVRAFVAACLTAAGWRPAAKHLARWHQAWLAAAAEPAPGWQPARSGAPIPRQLPVAPGGFVGRRASLATLDALLPPVADGPTATAVCVVEGPAGVGKTALAVHWAHRNRDRFPGGQLCLNLRGYSPDEPLSPAHALAHFLRALGVAPQEVPTDVAESAALYRSLLADRPALVLLDDAADAEQVRPLIPGGAACLTLITSRTQLAGLTAREGAQRIALEVLHQATGRQLLATILGAQTVEADPAATDELIRVCAHLPLALRIAAAHIAYHPPHRITDFLAELRKSSPLEALRLPGEAAPAMPVTFDLSYARLDPAAQRMFRRFALAPRADLTVAAAAALTARPASATERDLDTLVGTHLLRQPSPGRYACHDLLRAYAADRAAAEESTEQREQALDRLYEHYLLRAEAATRLLYPQALRLPRPVGDARPDPSLDFASAAEAGSWLDAELANLVAVVNHAAQAGSPVAWLLGGLLPSYLNHRSYRLEGEAIVDASLAAATAAGDRPGQAIALLCRVGLDQRRGDHPRAIESARSALALADEAGWDEGAGAALRSLGVSRWHRGELRQAAGLHRQAFERFERAGWRPGRAAAANSLGVVYLDLGALARAKTFTEAALAYNRESGSVAGQAANLATLAQIHLEQGRPDLAHTCFIDAQEHFHQLGDRAGVGNSLRGRAAVHQALGQLAEARALVQAALAVAREVGEPHLESAALNTFASVDAGAGDLAAVDHYQRALAVARAAGSRYQAVTALIGIADTLLRWRCPIAATRYARQALETARTAGYRLLQRRALAALSSAQLLLPGGAERSMEQLAELVATDPRAG